MSNTKKFVTDFKNYFNINLKDHTLREMSKILTKIYKQTHIKKKKKILNYSDFGSEFNIESLSEPVKKTLSKFESDDVKEHWRKYGDWVYMNKECFKQGAHRFHKGDHHERHLSKQRIEFQLYGSIQNGKDVKDTETDVAKENKNIEIIKTKNKIKFRLWNFHTSKNENLDQVLERKKKNKEYADIYILSNEDITVIIPSVFFIKEYFSVKSDGIDIVIPFSKCKAIWIRDFTKEIDTTQKTYTIERYEKFLEETGPKI